MTVQFFKITYKVPTVTKPYTIYERGRAKLMKAIGEIVSAKGTFTVEPVATEDVPSTLRKELEEVR